MDWQPSVCLRVIGRPILVGAPHPTKAKQSKLEAKGWQVGSTQDFLGLSDQESALIELRLSLAKALRAWRLRRDLS